MFADLPNRAIFLHDTSTESIAHECAYLHAAYRQRRERGESLTLGGATGRTHLALYQSLHDLASLDGGFDLGSLQIIFLDEYFGAPVYAPYAHQHLRVGQPGGFRPENVWVPRGAFYDDTSRLVSNAMLDAVLKENPSEWEALSEPGDDGMLPEIRIRDTARHPVLTEIRESCARYETLVRTRGSDRLQLLGIGARGHIGFVEAGAARWDQPVSLMRLCPTTRCDNAFDFELTNGDGQPVRMEPALFAITQGIGSILSAAELLLAAHGPKKQQAVRDMLQGTPCATNPAAYVQEHPRIRLFLDRAAFGELNKADLQRQGFEVITDSAAKLPGRTALV